MKMEKAGSVRSPDGIHSKGTDFRYTTSPIKVLRVVIATVKHRDKVAVSDGTSRYETCTIALGSSSARALVVEDDGN